MSKLQQLKKRLNIDQRNILHGTVVSNKADTVQVRLRSGETRSATKRDGAVAYTAGDLVELTTTDGVTLIVERVAPFRPPGGQLVVSV